MTRENEASLHFLFHLTFSLLYAILKVQYISILVTFFFKINELGSVEVKLIIMHKIVAFLISFVLFFLNRGCICIHEKHVRFHYISKK